MDRLVCRCLLKQALPFSAFNAMSEKALSADMADDYSVRLLIWRMSHPAKPKFRDKQCGTALANSTFSEPVQLSQQLHLLVLPMSTV